MNCAIYVIIQSDEYRIVVNGQKEKIENVDIDEVADKVKTEVDAT